MGNLIFARATADLTTCERAGLTFIDRDRDRAEALTMSNGLTSVVVSLFALAASAEASSEAEQILTVQVASADQSVFGIGVVGFNLTDLSWAQDRDTFDAQRRFVATVIDRALAMTDWHLLDYQPAEDTAIEALSTLRRMVDELRIDSLPPVPPSRLLDAVPNNIGSRCERDGVLLHRYGCVVCNDR